MAKHEFAIKVDNVYKSFKLPHERISSIKSFITQGYKRQRGYENQHALDNISFEVKQGEFFGIVGRNGSGKSTLLKILAEIYRPSKGNVTVRGRLVPFIELGVGFNPELTGRENVYLNGALLGFSKKEIDDMYDDIVSFAELERFMDQKLKNYSSGMQVRLAFSVATRAKADILLVDEVLAVGDADFQRKCFSYFKQLKKEKKTVVFVSHDMNAVREYCDRAILIEKSKIIEQGQVARVATAYTKMFIDGSDSVSEKISRKRWGDKKIEYTSVSATLDEQTNETITVRAEFVVHHDVTSPLLGMTVKNGAGTEMFGINNRLAHVKTGVYKAGSKGVVEWKTINVLNDGDYSVDVAAVDNDDYHEHDWWEDACAFSVRRIEHTPYVIEPSIDMKISTGESNKE